MDLKEARIKLDEIDAQLTELFVKRMEISEDVAAYKIANNMPILNKDRENAILEEESSRAGATYAPYIREMYNCLFDQSKKLQEERFKGKE